MTTSVVDAAAPSQVLPALLQLIAGPAPSLADRVRLFTADGEAVVAPAASAGRAGVPPVVLAWLEDRRSVFIDLATNDRLAVLPVRWRLDAVDEQGRDRSPTAAIDAILARLEALPTPPVAVLFGGTRIVGSEWYITAVWPLAEPLALSAPEAITAAVAQVAAAAAALDGLVPDEDISSWHLDLPGSVQRVLPNLGHEAECLMWAPTPPQTLASLITTFQTQETTR